MNEKKQEKNRLSQIKLIIRQAYKLDWTIEQFELEKLDLELDKLTTYTDIVNWDNLVKLALAEGDN